MIDLVRVIAFLIRSAKDLRFSRGLVALVILTSILSGAASTAFLPVITQVLNHSGPLRELMWTFILLCVALPVLRFSSGVLLLRMTQKVLLDLRLQFCHRILETPLRQLESVGPARIQATVLEDIAAIVAAVGSLPGLILNLTVVLGCLIYLGYLSLYLLALLLAFGVIGVLSYQLPMIKAQAQMHVTRESWDAFVELLRGLTEGTKELKIHRGRRVAFLRQELEPTVESMRRHLVASNTIYTAANSWGQILFFVAIGLMLFVMPTFQSFDGTTLTGFVLAVFYLMTPLDSLLNMLPTLSRAAVSVSKVESMGLSLVGQELLMDEVGAPAAPQPSPGWRRLELTGVTYRYGDGAQEDQFVFGPVSLELQPGELVFIIGGNGSGKTTLAKLLIGLYQPDGGEIRLDGQAITEDGFDRYRQLFSVVFSDSYLFQRLLGLDSHGLDEQASDYLTELQLEHKVRIEGGKLSSLDLSQGQRKRLALLTAYLEDRPIYVFDEWAADQDPQFREVFYSRMLPELKARGKTVVVISHDDHYYFVADRIVKLEYGHVEYEGDTEARASPVSPGPDWPSPNPGDPLGSRLT